MGGRSTACIKALESLKVSTMDIDVYSDSAYLVNGINEKWYENWERNNWENSKKKPVENQDLWEQLLSLFRKYQISFHKVSGHSGVQLNELADRLARKGIEEQGGTGRRIAPQEMLIGASDKKGTVEKRIKERPPDAITCPNCGGLGHRMVKEGPRSREATKKIMCSQCIGKGYLEEIIE
ncbi:ribonuclease H [Chloroflexota bacterium]